MAGGESSAKDKGPWLFSVGFEFSRLKFSEPAPGLTRKLFAILRHNDKASSEGVTHLSVLYEESSVI
jgi:hypothetical protein